ncbi:alanine/ornithine racemase family PLP-dependent enzyme [Dendrosporobacter sp. 1207_IL3150]|uniref:alanine/ornithine racemase family PLP-dependent enzyme n=1 Tax=Dendrosporobacter sp. 1207_IL3150 TaxID=3084054 RepID=UPI002FDB02A7
MQGAPTLEIDLEKLADNSSRVVEKCLAKGIHVIGVTKGFSAIHQIVSAMLAGGIEGFADARMENIMELRKRNFHSPFTLLRIPRISNVANVVKYADVSINSEISVIRALSAEAQQIGKIHKIILMLDVGDLREGVMREDVMHMVEKISCLEGIRLIGIGTNMGCFGGVLPSIENLNLLVDVAYEVESHLDYQLEIISGGGTSTLFLVENNTVPAGINQLRVGEGILLGTDTTNNRNIPWLHHDAFCLKAEVIEVKDKPSVPIGEIGQDAFGNVPRFVDVGIRKRAILALGKQDVYIEGLFTLDKNITILGASSDHIILDVTDSGDKIRVGDEVIFGLTYPGLLSASDSRYVKKLFKGGNK